MDSPSEPTTVAQPASVSVLGPGTSSDATPGVETSTHQGESEQGATQTPMPATTAGDDDVNPSPSPTTDGEEEYKGEVVGDAGTPGHLDMMPTAIQATTSEHASVGEAVMAAESEDGQILHAGGAEGVEASTSDAANAATATDSGTCDDTGIDVDDGDDDTDASAGAGAGANAGAAADAGRNDDTCTDAGATAKTGGVGDVEIDASASTGAKTTAAADVGANDDTGTDDARSIADAAAGVVAVTNSDTECDVGGKTNSDAESKTACVVDADVGHSTDAGTGVGAPDTVADDDTKSDAGTGTCTGTDVKQSPPPLPYHARPARRLSVPTFLPSDNVRSLGLEAGMMSHGTAARPRRASTATPTASASTIGRQGRGGNSQSKKQSPTYEEFLEASKCVCCVALLLCCFRAAIAYRVDLWVVDVGGGRGCVRVS